MNIELAIENKSASAIKPKIKLREQAVFLVNEGKTTKFATTTRAKAKCKRIPPSSDIQIREAYLDIPEKKISQDMQLPQLWNIKVSHHIEVNERISTISTNQTCF